MTDRLPSLPPILTPPERFHPMTADRWPVREETLPNGMKVRLLEDHSVPACVMQTYFGVGSKDEVPGGSGISHFLEHMMFNGTPKVGPRQFDHILESRGGQSNAFTTRDMTAYENVFPAASLECVLALEGDRMRGLLLDGEATAAERSVVMEERRVSTDESPGGRLDEALYALAFRVHGYRIPVIGYAQDLEKLCPEACRAHFRRHYAPDNATLWLCGDFDGGKAMEAIRRHFGDIPSSGLERGASGVQEPEQDGERRTEISFPAHSETLLVGYKAPAARHQDAAAIALLAQLLCAGQGSRLTKKFVYDDGMAVSAAADFTWQKDPGLFQLQLDLVPGVTCEDALAALDAFLDNIVRDGFTQDELETVRASCLSSRVKALSTCLGRCETLATCEQVLGDWRGVFRIDRQVEEMTLEDVRLAMERLFRRERRNLVFMRCGDRDAATPAPLEDGEEAPDAFGDGEGQVHPSPAEGAAEGIPSGDGECADGLAGEIPPLDPSIRLQVPEALERTLPNGMRIAVARHATVPLAAMSLHFLGGSACEPVGKGGLADFTMELLFRGTSHLGASRLSDALDRLGCGYSVGTTLEGHAFSLSCPSSSIVPALELLDHMVRNPAFSPWEIEAFKDRTVSNLAVDLDDPGTLLMDALAAVTYPGHPFGKVSRGTPASVRSFTRQDVLAMSQAILSPQNAILTIVGDLDPERTMDMAVHLFESWRPTGCGLPSIPPPETPSPAILVVDIPGSEQAQVAMACAGPRRGEPGGLAAAVGAYLLGGAFTSRLMEAVRVRRGLTYGLSATCTGFKAAGRFSVTSFTRNETLRQLVDVVLEETRAFREGGLRPGELLTAKRLMVSAGQFSVETAPQLAAAMGECILMERPRDFTARSLERIVRLTDEDVMAAAERWFFPGDRCCIAAAGNAEEIAAALKGLPGPLNVVSREELSEAAAGQVE